MSDVVMEAVNVEKVLGTGPAQVRALKGVSLALRGGELTLLMGPSGSGKTTLLSILGCMLTPTAGKVRVRLECFGPQQGSLSAGQVEALFRDFLRHGAVRSFEVARTEVSGDRYAMVRAVVGLTDRDGAERRVDLHLAFQVEDGRLALREIRETAP